SVTVAGEFSEFHSVPMPRVARLRSDGTLDPGFDPGSGPNGPVHALHPASDGRVWIAGGFTAFDGVARNRVARLLPDGSPDPDFIPGPGPDDGVFALSDGPGGTLAIGGIFTRVDGFLRGGVATLIVSPVGPPRFTAVTISDAGLEWEAAAPDGQPPAAGTTSSARRTACSEAPCPRGIPRARTDSSGSGGSCAEARPRAGNAPPGCGEEYGRAHQMFAPAGFVSYAARVRPIPMHDIRLGIIGV